MAGTPLSLFVEVIDLDLNSPVASSTVLGAYKRTRATNGAGTGSIFANAGTNVCNALIDCSGGANLAGPIGSYALRVSEDGGATWDYRTVITKPVRHLAPPYGVSHDGPDYAGLLTLTGEDRVTWFNTPLADILTNAGTDGRPKGFLKNTIGKPNQAGADEITPAVHIGGTAAKIRLDVDIWADYLTNALTTACALLGGAYVPGVPMGQFTAWHYDPRLQAIQVGKLPTTPHVTFQPAGVADQGNWAEEVTIARYIADGLEPAHQLDQMISQVEFVGGASDHGLPAGGTVSCQVQINTDRPANSSRWDDQIQIVGVSAQHDQGGVYLNPRHGRLVRVSQPMDVRAMVLDAQGQRVLVATGHGVFAGAYASILAAKPFAWTRIGGLTAPCLDLTCQYGVIVTLVSGAQGTGRQKSGAGVDGVYLYPALTGTVTGKGYDGWTQLASGSITTFAYRREDDVLLVVDSNAPDAVARYQPAGPGSLSFGGGGGIIPPGPGVLILPPAAIPASGPAIIKTSDGSSITGLAFDTAGCYVLTELGSAGLLYLPDGATRFFTANDGSLASNGVPVPVNDVVAMSGITTLKYKADDGSIQSVKPMAVALTAAGLFATLQTGGRGGWTELTRNSGLATENLQWFSVGGPQTVLGRQMTVVFTGHGSAIYVSCNEGRDWLNILGAPLDMGPFWQTLATTCGAGVFADTDVGALGNTPQSSTPSGGSLLGAIGGGLAGIDPTDPSQSDTGGYGRTFAIPTTITGFGQLPKNWIWARRLDKLGQFTYRLVNLVSQAPAGGIRFDSLTALIADAATPVDVASENVARVSFSFLAIASTPQTVIPVQSQYHTQEAALRTLGTGDLAYFTGALTVDSTAGLIGDGEPTVLLNVTNLPLWVLEHTAEMSGNSTMLTTTRLATRMGEQLVDPQDIAAALATDARKQKLRWRQVKA